MLDCLFKGRTFFKDSASEFYRSLFVSRESIDSLIKKAITYLPSKDSNISSLSNIPLENQVVLLFWSFFSAVILYAAFRHRAFREQLRYVIFVCVAFFTYGIHRSAKVKDLPTEPTVQLVVPLPDTNLYDFVRIDDANTYFGVVGREHPQYVKPNSLGSMGFKFTRSFVVFNPLLVNGLNANRDEFTEESVISYGIEALHVDGYEMTCIGDEVSPKEIIEGISYTNIPGEKFRLPRGQIVICSSYRVGTLVRGALAPEMERPRKEEKEEETLGGRLIGYAQSIFNWGKQEDKDSRKEQEPEKVKTSFVGMCSAPYLRLYKDNTGRARNTLGTNYLNSYGPPAPYLAYV